MSDREAETLIPGLGMTEEDLAYIIEQDRRLIEEGLEHAETYARAMETQDAERDALNEAALARGEEVKVVLTDEERAWNEFENRGLSGIAQQKRTMLAVFGLDPRNSALFPEFSDLLIRACDPQKPVHYDPSSREFGLMETWGPAIIRIDHCPWTGKALPASLDELWCETVSAELETEDWSMDDARARLPDFFTEAWWISRGL